MNCNFADLTNTESRINEFFNNREEKDTESYHNEFAFERNFFIKQVDVSFQVLECYLASLKRRAQTKERTPGAKFQNTF